VGRLGAECRRRQPSAAVLVTSCAKSPKAPARSTWRSRAVGAPAEIAPRSAPRRPNRTRQSGFPMGQGLGPQSVRGTADRVTGTREWELSVRLEPNTRPAVYKSEDEASIRVHRRPIFPSLRQELSSASNHIQVRLWDWLQLWLHTEFRSPACVGTIPIDNRMDSCDLPEGLSNGRAIPGSRCWQELCSLTAGNDR